MTLPELSSKWMRNKNELGFSGRVVFEKESMSVIIDKAQRKYVKAIKELAGKILIEGIKVMSEAFSFSVASKDATSEGDKVKSFLENRKVYLLNLLLDKGYTAFAHAVSQDAMILKLKYDLCTISCTEKGWTKWDGAILTADGWLYPDGRICNEPLAQLLSGTSSNAQIVA